MAAPLICTTITQLRARLLSGRALRVEEGGGIAMVPTMGALHEGHLSLVTTARERSATIVVSIFVNPTQFAPHEDFEAYPRNLERDVAMLEASEAPGTSQIIVFAPTAREMYPQGFCTTVTLQGPTAGLESDVRPHFFAGVATIVAKLLIAALPDFAVFGEKDYQQLQVVKRLVKDLALPTQIVGAPTAREADGLALSSRNAYLGVRERAIAGNLNLVMKDVAARAKQTGDLRDAEAFGASALIATGFDSVDYVAIRDSESLSPVDTLEKPARLLIAAKTGKTRLIDNMAL
jgi:pantoate--beta-alanine ligase